MANGKNGQFKKGHKKTGGRKKGTPNLVSASMKERIKSFIDDNFDLIADDIRELDPLERVRFYLKMMEFVIPRQKHMDIDTTNKTELINVVFTSTGVEPVHHESEIVDFID